MFRTVPLSIIRSFLLYTQQWYMLYRFADSLRAGSGRNQFRPDPVEFYSKNKFEKVAHLFGFIIIIYHDARSPERHNTYLDCIEIAYELPLPPNKTANETFYKNLERCGSVDPIFIIGAPAWRRLGEHVTLGKTFYNLFFKQEAAAAPVTATISSLSHSSSWILLDI